MERSTYYIASIYLFLCLSSGKWMIVRTQTRQMQLALPTLLYNFHSIYSILRDPGRRVIPNITRQFNKPYNGTKPNYFVWTDSITKNIISYKILLWLLIMIVSIMMICNDFISLVLGISKQDSLQDKLTFINKTEYEKEVEITSPEIQPIYYELNLQNMHVLQAIIMTWHGTLPLAWHRHRFCF